MGQGELFQVGRPQHRRGYSSWPHALGGRSRRRRVGPQLSQILIRYPLGLVEVLAVHKPEEFARLSPEGNGIELRQRQHKPSDVQWPPEVRVAQESAECR